MTPAAIKTVVAAIMAAAVVFALVWLHNTLAERHYQPTIDSLNKTLGSVKQHNANLTAQLQAQNAAMSGIPRIQTTANMMSFSILYPPTRRKTTLKISA